jgi:hypothetical protein
VWSLLRQIPASEAAGADLDDVNVLDVDATLVASHSDKQLAAPNFKGGYGFHPDRGVVRQLDRAPGDQAAPGQRRSQWTTNWVCPADTLVITWCVPVCATATNTPLPSVTPSGRWRHPHLRAVHVSPMRPTVLTRSDNPGQPGSALRCGWGEGRGPHSPMR